MMYTVQAFDTALGWVDHRSGLTLEQAHGQAEYLRTTPSPWMYHKIGRVRVVSDENNRVASMRRGEACRDYHARTESGVQS